MGKGQRKKTGCQSKSANASGRRRSHRIKVPCSCPSDELGRCHWPEAGENAFYVDRIVDSRLKRISKELLFFVKWKYYSKKHNTWEPVAQFDFCPVTIEEYFRGARPKTKKFRYRKLYEHILRSSSYSSASAQSSRNSSSSLPSTLSEAVRAAQVASVDSNPNSPRRLQVSIRKLDPSEIPKKKATATTCSSSDDTEADTSISDSSNENSLTTEASVDEDSSGFEFLDGLFDFEDADVIGEAEEELLEFWDPVVFSPAQNLPPELEHELSLYERRTFKRHGRYGKPVGVDSILERRKLRSSSRSGIGTRVPVPSH